MPGHVGSLTSLALALALFASPAVAQPEKILDTSTGWTYLYGATATTINNGIAAGQRPFTIERVGSNAYDVVTVTNSGSYGVSGFGTGNMHYNRTATQLGNELTSRRLVSLDCYEVSGQTLMTAISIPNTGSSGAGWGWLVGQTRQQIVDWISNSTTPQRVVDLSVYTVGGVKKYSAVAVVNQGAQAQGWWWYFDVTLSQVSDLLQQNGARLIDLEIETPATVFSSARYAVVMVAQNPGAGWVHTGLSESGIEGVIGQTGGRLTNLTRYTDVFGNTRYLVSLVDNANAQTRRVRDYMAAQVTTGSYGFRLKQVGGPVIASLNENFRFEPASTLKIVHASFAIRQAAAGLVQLSDDIFVPNRCTTQFWNDACPEENFSCDPGNSILSLQLRRMMQDSHNGATRAIEDHFGRADLNAFASGPAGLPNTVINHSIGCGAPPNVTTCLDMANLYERIANGTFFTSVWRDELFSRMNSANGFSSGLTEVISEEAASTGLTIGELQSFRNAVDSAFKRGGYTYDGVEYSSVAGWISIPFTSFSLEGWVTTHREYAFASFVHAGQNPGADAVAYGARSEMVREQIREALLSWDAACAVSVATQPANTSVDQGQDAQFTTAAGGAGAAQFQWEISYDGSGFFAVSSNSELFSGAKTNTLTVVGAQPTAPTHYRCRITKDCGQVTTNAVTLTVVPTDPTAVPSVLPTHLVMHAPTPNPFNPKVTLRYELPRFTDTVTLEIYDLAGRRVRALSTSALPAGAHEFVWNGTDESGQRVASGMYVARLQAGGETATHRMMLVK